MFLGRKARPWWRPEGRYGDSGKKWGESSDTSNVETTLSP
jgi:hypothetical protein